MLEILILFLVKENQDDSNSNASHFKNGTDVTANSAK